MGANASTAVPLYASGQVLDAARLNLTNSGIPVFSGTATRDAAFGGSGEKVLAEGQFAYLEDSNALQFYDGAAFQPVGGARIGQVVSTAKTDTFTTTSASFVDVTGLSVTITPTSATSKILVMASVSGQGASGITALQGRLMRDSTAIAIGDAAGSRQRASFGNVETGSSNSDLSSIMFLDSPATTASTTYKIQVLSGSSPQTVVINRSTGDIDNVQLTRTISTITVMEVIV